MGWRKGHAYLYQRTYVGAIKSDKPRYTEVYLGRVDDERARVADQAELKFMAMALVRKNTPR